MSGTQPSQAPPSASASHGGSSGGSSSKEPNPYEVSAQPWTHPEYLSGLTGVQQTSNYLFVNIILAVFFGLMLATLIFRVCNLGNMYLRFIHATGAGREKQMYWKTNKTEWWPWIKRHLLYAPLFSKRHNQVIKLTSVVTFGTLPSRFHSILIFVFVTMNLAYCAVLDYSNKQSEAVWAEWRGRTGMLATLNMIPTFLFALRNNPLIPLLQVSYDTFNLLHRWLARIVIIESILHTLAWFIPKMKMQGFEGVKHSIPKSEFLMWGTVATLVFIFMGLQAWSPLRHAFYETFLNIHKLAAIACIVGVYLHCSHGELPEVQYVQIVIAFWALEYVFRTGRIVYRNWARQSGLTRVTIEALPAEACRITYHLARPWKFSPGVHIHAYLPRYGLLSSHPFSVAWSEDHVRSSLSDDEKLPTTGPLKVNELDLQRSGTVRTDVSLIVRSFTGMTSHVYKAACNAPNKVITTWGAIEGPYGGHESLDSFGTVLMFAGGVGITHQLSYIRHLVAGAGNAMVAARKIILVWSVPTTENLEWIRPYMDEILRYPGRREVLKIMLFVTKPRSRNEIMSNTGSVAMYPGRCSPGTIVEKEFLEREGAMAVTVCGPGPFADSVRQASRRLCEVGSVTFVEEAFTY
ncbi:MAG: hypothetical protein Q9162_004652 [Coniocarpon cinnabarinum]